MNFKYGAIEIEYLKTKDKKLARLIDAVGYIDAPLDEDIFSSLMHQIIGQQIAMSAQITVWNRLQDKVSDITPNNIANLSDDELQSIGLTYKKVSYMKGIAQKILSGKLNLDALWQMSDSEVIKVLSSLHGIGKWTSEMILMFSMHRMDIFSYGDLAILRGLRMLYHHKDIDKKRFERYRKRFSPYGSVASLYIWALAEGRLIPEDFIY